MGKNEKVHISDGGQAKAHKASKVALKDMFEALDEMVQHHEKAARTLRAAMARIERLY
jgi:hypothetical protein